MSQMHKTPYVNVATITKTQGLKGQVVVTRTASCPFAVVCGAQVYFTPPLLRGIRSAVIETIEGDDYSALVSFEEIDNIGDAEQLVGKTILARRDDLDEEVLYKDAFIGRSVVCRKRGPVGTIVEVIETPANLVWMVEGCFGEVLVPVIDSVVLDIPEDSDMPISVELLAGLVDGEAEVIDETSDSRNGGCR